MSRSRKKTPSYSDYNSSYTPWSKRQASKAVRRYKGVITNGALYKKIYPTYDIFDYKGIWINDIPDKAYRK